MPITWGTFTCLEPISATMISPVISSSAEENFMYTAKTPGPDSNEDASEIGSDGENELYPRVGCMHDAEDKYIYQLRVERADRNRQIYAEAQFKDVST